MKMLTALALTGALGAGLVLTPSPAMAQRDAANAGQRRSQSVTAPSHEPPGGTYKKVSSLVPLPDFIPGLGTLYVDPATLPAGPFLAYDHQGDLVSSIYMIPLKDLNSHKGFNNLAVAHEKVDHVDVVFNAGHPGVAEPHYHMILWYITAAQAARLAK